MMPCQIYKYFKLDTIAVFNKPIAPAKSIDKLTLEKVKIHQVQKLA